MSDSLALSVRALRKSFGGGFDFGRLLPWRRTDGARAPLRVVDDVSFEVRRGEIYGVICANGSGKSTLVRILSTLLLPDAGEVRVFGFDVVRDSMTVRGLINRVSADPSFFRSMSAMENLLFFGRVYGLSPEQVRERAPSVLAPGRRADDAPLPRPAAEGGGGPRLPDLPCADAAGRADDRARPAQQARRAGLHPGSAGGA